MEVVLGILFAFAAIAAILMGLQVGGARAASNKALSELEALKQQLSGLRDEAKKSTEGLEAKRKEAEELKEKLRDVKKRRYEEKEASKLKSDLETARAEIEREMEHKLAVAREEAEVAKGSLKKATAEVEALKSRRPVREEKPAEAKAEPAAEKAPREPSAEEKARQDSAEKQLGKAREQLRSLDEEVKRLKGRAETDRRVFIVQKGELDVAKDKFRALEAKHSALTLERDDLAKKLVLVEREMKSLRPTAEEPKAAEAAKSEEAGKPSAPAPNAPEAKA